MTCSHNFYTFLLPLASTVNILFTYIRAYSFFFPSHFLAAFPLLSLTHSFSFRLLDYHQFLHFWEAISVLHLRHLLHHIITPHIFVHHLHLYQYQTSLYNYLAYTHYKKTGNRWQKKKIIIKRGRWQWNYPSSPITLLW